MHTFACVSCAITQDDDDGFEDGDGTEHLPAAPKRPPAFVYGIFPTMHTISMMQVCVPLVHAVEADKAPLMMEFKCWYEPVRANLCHVMDWQCTSVSAQH